MVGLSIKQFKSGFFDPTKVIAGVDRATERSMSKAGAFIRRTSKSSINKSGKKQHSKPGEPPRKIVGTLHKLLYFAWEPNSKSVVIGPAGFGKAEVPGRLEFGSNAVRSVQVKSAGHKASPAQAAAYHRKLRDGSLVRPTTARKQVAGKLSPRPYMGPAMTKEVEAGNVVGPWANSVRAN